jgi:glycerophosphoryl diester phosphodiesterase
MVAKPTVIPTISEVFAIIPENKTIFVEVKCGVEIIPALLKEMEKSGLNEKQILIISFNEAVIQELKLKAPKYRASWLCSFNKQKSGEITPSSETVLATMKRIQTDGLSSNTAIPEALIDMVRKQGYTWNVWTVDDLKTARSMKALGTASITTNAPKIIREGLTESSPSGDLKESAP